MLEDIKLEKAIKDFVVDVCEVLYRRGIDRVSIGAVMRLLGMSAEVAEKYDDSYFNLDQEFQNILEEKNFATTSATSAPDDAVLH
jgi:hypothetical protein